MKISVTNIISIYEIVAIALAILIPLGKWIITKYIIKTKLRFIPSGYIDLWFNQSGSYFQIDGVYEASRKSTNIEKISATIERKGDGVKLNHEWYQFISPTNPVMMGTPIQTIEIAHPIRIEKDSIICAFIRFCDHFESDGKEFKAVTEKLFSCISELREKHQGYNNAKTEYMALPEYVKARNTWEKRFYWHVGQYTVNITVNYGDHKECNYAYSFSISEHDNSVMLLNIDESLISPLKSKYNETWDYHNVSVQLNELKK